MTRPSPTTMRLLVLAAATFVFVTTETQPVALLSPMARGLSVSESTIGLLMTVYAGVAALSTIPLTALAGRIGRRRLLCATVATLVVSQVALALAPNYGVALGARVIGALAHGVFWSVLAQVAAGLVPREQVGRATAITYAGNSLALVAGTPLVSALGALVGWRAAVSVMGVIALVIVIAMARILPEIEAAPVGAGRRGMLAQALRDRGVALVCAITLLLAFGQFLAFTYLAPLVRAHTGLTGTGLSLVLLAYGAAGVLGVARVAALADRRPRLAMLACCVLIIAGLALIVGVAHGTAAMVIAVVLWGAGFTGLPICLQSAVLRVAPELPDTASSLYVSAFQVGIGGGSLAGSALLSGGELTLIPLIALALFVAGSLIAAAARATFAGPPATSTPAPGARTAPRRSRPRPSAARGSRARGPARPRARR